MKIQINETRDKKVTVRFTSEEKKLMELHADHKGFKNVSDLIRSCVEKEINGDTSNKKK